MGRIHLLRHGQAQWQLDRQGDLDSALTPLGHRQAEAAARWLAAPRQESRWTPQLVSSPLVRARQTAAYVAAMLQLEAEIWPELAEATFRVADHLPRRPGPADPLPAPSADYLAYRDQAARALDRLYAAAVGERDIVAVTHGGMIRTLLRVAAGSDAICFDIPNGAITLLEWQEGRWQVGALGACEHLAPEGRSR